MTTTKKSKGTEPNTKALSSRDEWIASQLKEARAERRRDEKRLAAFIEEVPNLLDIVDAAEEALTELVDGGLEAVDLEGDDDDNHNSVYEVVLRELLVRSQRLRDKIRALVTEAKKSKKAKAKAKAKRGTGR